MKAFSVFGIGTVKSSNEWNRTRIMSDGVHFREGEVSRGTGLNKNLFAEMEASGSFLHLAESLDGMSVKGAIMCEIHESQRSLCRPHEVGDVSYDRHDDSLHHLGLFPRPL